MQNRWLTSHVNPNKQIAHASAASSSSSSSSLDHDNDTRMDSRPPVPKAKASNERGQVIGDFKGPRSPKPPNPDWPHLNFLELMAQWADHACFDDEGHGKWMQCNEDFSYCLKHQELVEMIKHHPVENYNRECSQCLNPHRSAENGILGAFFARQHLSIKSLPEAANIWLGLFNDREGMRKKHELALKESKQPMSSKQSQNAASEVERAFNTCSMLERSAFLWYYFLAWEKTQYRITAIKEHAASPGNSSKFNMLPLEAEDDLMKFNAHCRVRGSKTAAGRSGQKTYNSRACDIHASKTGHMIHGYSKDRYEACGICVKPQEVSITQKMLNDLASGNGAQHPPVHFAAPKPTPGSRHGKFRGPSAAAAAKVTASVHRMQSLSLEDEAVMN